MARVFRSFPRGWEGAEDDEGVKILGGTEGVHPEAGQGWRAGGRALPQGRVSQATYFNWKKKYDGLLPTEMRRLKQLEDGNTKLRKVVADLSLDKEMLQDIIRLYREEGLAVKRRRGRRRAIGTRAPIVVPQEMNQRCSLGFVSDQLGNGRRFQLLNVIDDFNSECLAAIPDFSLSGLRVIRELEAIIAIRASRR